jgi:deoxycytidylate deaminase
MTLPKVIICGYCGRSLGLESDRRLPPGEHMAKIRVTTAPCERCKVKLDELGVSHSVITKRYTKEEKK